MLRTSPHIVQQRLGQLRLHLSLVVSPHRLVLNPAVSPRNPLDNQVKVQLLSLQRIPVVNQAPNPDHILALSPLLNQQLNPGHVLAVSQLVNPAHIQQCNRVDVQLRSLLSVLAQPLILLASPMVCPAANPVPVHPSCHHLNPSWSPRHSLRRNRRVNPLINHYHFRLASQVASQVASQSVNLAVNPRLSPH